MKKTIVDLMQNQLLVAKMFNSGEQNFTDHASAYKKWLLVWLLMCKTKYYSGVCMRNSESVS